MNTNGAASPISAPSAVPSTSHLPLTPAHTTSSSMSKLEVLKFSGPLNSPTVNAWLNKCKNIYEGYEAINLNKITSLLQILFTGIAIEESITAKWWEENQMAFKALRTWPKFITKVKEQFNLEGWKVAAVIAYYRVRQGKKDFCEL
jgi:hypothetical protein